MGGFPLNTGLLLSPNDGKGDADLAGAPDNGFLQAWEVIGQMHLDADLVTLWRTHLERIASPRADVTPLATAR